MSIVPGCAAFIFPMRFADPPPPLHMHSVFEFYGCRRGGFQHTVTGTRPMSHGEIWCFPPGVAHIGSGARHGHSQAVVVNLGPESFDPGDGRDEIEALLGRIRAWCTAAGHRLDLSPAGCRRSLATMTALAGEHRTRRPGFRLAIRGHLFAFLRDLARDERLGPALARDLAPASEDEQLAMVLRTCETAFRRHLPIAELAALAGLSRSRFHSVFRRVVGTTPVAHLTRLRLAEAQRLLRDTDGTVLDIALASGFGSLSRFYQAFVADTGVAPERWRRRWT